MRHSAVALLLGIAVAASSRAAFAQEPDALARGAELYAMQCARCHGLEGGGGEGPALVGRVYARAENEEGLVRIVLRGIGGTAMPAAGWLGEQNARLIAAYVWSLSRAEIEPVPGDPEAGGMLFRGKGECSTCHIVQGVGAGIGPELSDIGTRRDWRYLRRSLLNPGAVLPRGELGPHSSFLIVRATLSDGGTIRGMRVNEDAFVLVLRDRDGRYRTLQKADVAGLDREFGTSFMPDYRELMSEEEIMDLVAYLVSLRGSR